MTDVKLKPGEACFLLHQKGDLGGRQYIFVYYLANLGEGATYCTPTRISSDISKNCIDKLVCIVNGYTPQPKHLYLNSELTKDQKNTGTIPINTEKIGKIRKELAERLPGILVEIFGTTKPNLESCVSESSATQPK